MRICTLPASSHPQNSIVRTRKAARMTSPMIAPPWATKEKHEGPLGSYEIVRCKDGQGVGLLAFRPFNSPGPFFTEFLHTDDRRPVAEFVKRHERASMVAVAAEIAAERSDEFVRYARSLPEDHRPSIIATWPGRDESEEDDDIIYLRRLVQEGIVRALTETSYDPMRRAVAFQTAIMGLSCDVGIFPLIENLPKDLLKEAGDRNVAMTTAAKMEVAMSKGSGFVQSAAKSYRQWYASRASADAEQPDPSPKP